MSPSTSTSQSNDIELKKLEANNSTRNQHVGQENGLNHAERPHTFKVESGSSY
jgi:hypothetical protein